MRLRGRKGQDWLTHHVHEGAQDGWPHQDHEGATQQAHGRQTQSGSISLLLYADYLRYIRIVIIVLPIRYVHTSI